jgi:hypothetical protein
VVAVAFDHREPRVGGVDDEGNPLFGRFGDVDDVHLRARDHQVARTQFGHLQHPFDHRHGVGVEKVALVRVVQRFEQFFAVLGLAEDERGQAFQQASVLLRGGESGRRRF